MVRGWGLREEEVLTAGGRHSPNKTNKKFRCTLQRKQSLREAKATTQQHYAGRHRLLPLLVLGGLRDSVWVALSLATSSLEPLEHMTPT